MLFGWILVAAVIFASVSPDLRLALLSFDGADKVAHATSYCLLMLWFAGLYARRHHVVVALGLLSMGGLLELIQWQLPYRSFEPTDLLANTAGVLIGLGLAVWLLAGWCQRIESRLGYHD